MQSTQATAKKQSPKARTIANRQKRHAETQEANSLKGKFFWSEDFELEARRHVARLQGMVA